MVNVEMWYRGKIGQAIYKSGNINISQGHHNFMGV